MHVDLPDPDWYLDHVLLAAEPGGGSVGPARLARATWYRLWFEFTATSPGSPRAAPSSELAAVRRLAATQAFVVTRAQAAACGLGETGVRRLVRRQVITSVRHGVLAPCRTDPPALDDSVPGRSSRFGNPPISAAAAALVRPGARISHESAARAYGLPVLTNPTRPVLTHPQVRCAEGRRDLLVHAAPCAADDCVARTTGWPGVRDARLAVELADPRAESPLESLTRLCLHRGGIRPPEP